jgi:hypothetical protein
MYCRLCAAKIRAERKRDLRVALRKK